MKRIPILQLLVIAVITISCSKFDAGSDVQHGQNLPEKVENAKAVFMKEVSRVLTRGEFTNSKTAFNTGALTVDWDRYDININNKTGQDNVEMPVKALNRQVVTRTTPSGEKVRMMCWPKLIVTQSKSGKDGVYMVYFVPTVEYASTHRGDLSKVFNNSGDMGDYSGLKVYTKLDGPVSRINKYENGKKVAGVYFPKAKSLVQLRSAVAYGKQLLNGISFSSFRKKNSGTRSYYEEDCEGDGEEEIEECEEEEVPEEGDPDVEWIDELEVEVEARIEVEEELEELCELMDTYGYEECPGAVYYSNGVHFPDGTIHKGIWYLDLNQCEINAFRNGSINPAVVTGERRYGGGGGGAGDIEYSDPEEPYGVDEEVEWLEDEEEEEEEEKPEQFYTEIIKDILEQHYGEQECLEQKEKKLYTYVSPKCLELSVKYAKTFDPNFKNYGPYQNVIQLFEQKKNGYEMIHTDNYVKGIEYMIEALEAGKPVVVGVDENGEKRSYNEGTTDHFITIYGFRIGDSEYADIPKIEFYFVENGITDNLDKRAFSVENTLEYTPGYDLHIHGGTSRNDNRQGRASLEYSISQIRMYE